MMKGLQELFDAIAADDATAARRMIAERPELARAKNEDGLTAMQFVRYMGGEMTLEALIAAGPALDVFEAAQLGRAARVAELLDEDRSLVGAYSDDGFTALHFAAYYGSPETVGLLLDRGADIEAVTKNFLTNMPLHAAAAGRGPSRRVCELLLRRGANANATQHGGFTPLHTAGHTGDRAMAELFVEFGGDPAIANDEGKTAADAAREQGHVELAALLRSLARKGAG